MRPGAGSLTARPGLHHFVLAERYLAEATAANAETLLGALAEPGDLDFAFPFRPETLPVLRRAAAQSDHWGWRHLLGLNLWVLDRKEEARDILTPLRDRPDYGPAYVARAHLDREVGRYPGSDFLRATEFDPGSRVLRVELIRYLQDEEQWPASLQASARAREMFPGDFNLDLLHARALINLGGYLEAIEVLASTRVLPSENARESHLLYELAHVGAALDELDAGNHDGARAHLESALPWPESLGQGRPYDPDERLVRFVFGVAALAAGRARGGPPWSPAFSCVISLVQSGETHLTGMSQAPVRGIDSRSSLAPYAVAVCSPRANCPVGDRPNHVPAFKRALGPPRRGPGSLAASA